MVSHGKRGKFITFEGIDGAGKSSHIAGVADLIRAEGIHVLCTREPGGTPLGEKLRALLLHEEMHFETEALLMFAARREHLAKFILPTLQQGGWVLCDRFSDATYAYQGGGRGLDKEKFEQLEEWVHGYLQPDVTFLFDLPPSIASQRITSQGRNIDRFEQEAVDFHYRVRKAYLERVALFPQRIHVINADAPMDAIKEQVKDILFSYCL